MNYYEQAIWENLDGERETSRNSRAYITWVQQSLNRIINAGLVVDGIAGPRTWSAIRAFQRSVRLPADGIVGSRTEAALVARVGLPPAVSTPGIPSGGMASRTVQALRVNIVHIANQEWQRWNAGGRKTETDPPMRPVLQDYWWNGVGLRVTDRQLASPVWQENHPWSAAFISWVMRKAGAGSSFRYSAAHAIYIAWAKQNRLAMNANPFKAYRMTEVVPESGDLLCMTRDGSSATYDNIAPGMKTHCDIVTEVQGNRLVTIGGNISHTVSRRNPKVDSYGRVTQVPYFAVIKLTF